MSRVIYYIGAGASYGKRTIDDSGLQIIEEGLPVVSEIDKELISFRNYLAGIEVKRDECYVFKNLYSTTGESVIPVKAEILQDLDNLIQNAKDHATIDTYARKLFLTRRRRDFEKLKCLLCAFFIWEQLTHKLDQRYDTFLANVLSMQNLYLPPHISVISWNYDSQFELAYRYYTKNGTLAIYDKNKDGIWDKLKDFGRIFKVNGSATFSNINDLLNIIDDSTIPQGIQLLMFYGDALADTSQLGVQFKSHVSFAWEESENNANMLASITDSVAGAETVVVIGYSFPFFNRDTDRFIFSKMEKLKKVYIQDPNPEAVEPSLKAVLSEGTNIKIEYQKDCSQFYLPREL